MIVGLYDRTLGVFILWTKKKRIVDIYIVTLFIFVSNLEER